MNRQAFIARSVPHLDAVYRMARQLDRSPEGIADLVERTYLQALQVADRFDTDDRGLRLVLFKILHDEAYETLGRPDHLSKYGAEPGDVTLDAARPNESLPAWGSRSLDWGRIDGLLERASEHLWPEDRVLLFLWGAEELTCGDIAFVLDAPVKMVISRIRRARNRLVEKLVGLGDHPYNTGDRLAHVG